jgi:rod shape-determining protein MreD
MGEIALLGIKPNLLLLFATSWVLLRGLKEGFVIGLIGGMMLDVSSAAPFGVTALSLTAGISLAAIGEVNVFRGAWFLKFVVIAGATVVFNLIFMVLLGLSGHGVPLWLGIFRVMLPELLIHIGLMSVAYGLVKWLGARLGPQTVEF